MNKLNLLSKLAPMGVATLGAIAVSGIAAVPVNAQTFMGELFTGFINDANTVIDDEGNIFDRGIIDIPTEVDDKLFENFMFDLSPGAFQLGDLIEIGFISGEYFFEVDVSANGGPRPVDGTIMYEVSVLNGPGSFALAEIDSAVIGTGSFEITKDIEVLAGGGSDASIQSINGGSASTTAIAGATALKITDTFVSNGDSLEVADNGFIQTAPEPASLLGLLAVGGLGLGLKRKKQ